MIDPFGPQGTPKVAVIGAGFGGISTGVGLKRAGIDTFTIFELSERVGGTWWHNRYPGCEVDVESYVYSFPFKRYDWDADSCPPARAAPLPRGDGRRVRPASPSPAQDGRGAGGLGRGATSTGSR